MFVRLRKHEFTRRLSGAMGPDTRLLINIHVKPSIFRLITTDTLFHAPAISLIQSLRIILPICNNSSRGRKLHIFAPVEQTRTKYS